jgi:hypothetical protein
MYAKVCTYACVCLSEAGLLLLMCILLGISDKPCRLQRSIAAISNLFSEAQLISLEISLAGFKGARSKRWGQKPCKVCVCAVS